MQQQSLTTDTINISTLDWVVLEHLKFAQTMSRSVVADRLCPRIDNMQIENSVDNKENVLQCNGKLGHKMVRYTHGKFSSLHCFMITADIINVAFLLMSLCLRLCISW